MGESGELGAVEELCLELLAPRDCLKLVPCLSLAASEPISLQGGGGSGNGEGNRPPWEDLLQSASKLGTASQALGFAMQPWNAAKAARSSLCHRFSPPWAPHLAAAPAPIKPQVAMGAKRPQLVCQPSSRGHRNRLRVALGSVLLPAGAAAQGLVKERLTALAEHRLFPAARDVSSWGRSNGSGNGNQGNCSSFPLKSVVPQY